MISRPINLAIVNMFTLFRKVLKSFLSERNNLNVSVLASDILDVSTKLKFTSVDVLILDIASPQNAIADILRRILTEYPHIKILVVSAGNDLDLITYLIDSGIHGCISRSDEPEEMVRAIQSVVNDGFYSNRLLTEALYRNKQSSLRNHSDERMASLSEREKKILQLIWEEKSNKEMAENLFLGIRSIEKIRQDLKEKIGAKSTIGLLKFAIEKRIIDIHQPVPAEIQ
jgi:DNA-binding NarL/FixJ family response regulator